MSLDSLFAVTCGWLSGTGAESDVVVSSRIRLARNLAQFPFLSKANHNTRREILQHLRDGITRAVSPQNKKNKELLEKTLGEPVFPHKEPISAAELFYDDLEFIDVDDLSTLDRQFLTERQLISRELSEGHGSRGVLIADRQQVSMMLNEEDHLRMQVLRSGYDLATCWEEMNRLDDAIEREVSYAFHEQFGYLTACPTNVGTGIRVSVMVHLPALVKTKEIRRVFQSMQQMNIAVRGLYGEGSQAMGDYYQISNQITLGKSELEILELVNDVIPKVIAYERQVRQTLMEEKRDLMHDQVCRAYGILSNAREISSEETLQLLSVLRMGKHLGLIERPVNALANELLIYSQPAHLQKKMAKELNSAQRNSARAAFLRERLAVED